MSKLIDELTREHKIIVETLNAVNKVGIGVEEGQQMLMSVKENLLAHLQKEDEHVYPILNAASEKDPELKQTLEIYASNMHEISKAALDFFEKYANGGSGLEFGKDFGALYTALSLRIAKEEAVLYKKFDELNLSDYQE